MLMAAPSDAARPTKKSTKRLTGEARRCKDWCQRRDRAVHQSQEARLDLLEHDGITTTIRQRCIFQSHWESSGVYDNAEH